MELTVDNFKIYAASNYDNQTCLTEEEFESDLMQLKTIRRMMTRYINGEQTNIRLLTNNIIVFYNCFNHHAATNMLHHQIMEDQIQHFNSILKFLSLPMMNPYNYNINFYTVLEEEFK